MWSGFLADLKLGLFILHDTIHSNSYLNMLQKFVWLLVSVWDHFNDTVFMQDGRTLTTYYRERLHK